jgi:hypothetical protein
VTAGRQILVRFDFYPWAFALAPVASLLTENMDAISPRAALRASAALLGATLIGLLIGRRAFRNQRKAAVCWTLVVVTSFLLGHLAGMIAANRPTPQLPTIYLTTLVLWVMLIAVLASLVAKAKTISPSVAAGLNVAGLVALGIPLVQLIVLEGQMSSRWSSVQPAISSPPFSSASAQPPPDVYYIILDGYGRQDVLSELYGMDNQGFYDSLESRGFTIATKSYANYAQTSLSLASALNFSYLDHLSRDYPRDRSQWTVAGMIRHSSVVEILSAHGYSSVAFAIGYRRAEMSTADLFIDIPHPLPTPFEAILFEQSGLSGIMYLPNLVGAASWLPAYADRRESIGFLLERAASLPQVPGPKFTLIHVLAPHPPFIFDEEGRETVQRYPYRLGDGSEFLGTPEEYVQGYAAQVRYVNSAVLTLVDKLRAGSSTPPIIILQGDHGPGSQLDWNDASSTNMWERMAILNAYAIPGMSEESIDPGISPVNTFRLVLHHLFGTFYERLPNRSYFSSWKDPYKFLPVTFSQENTWAVDDSP